MPRESATDLADVEIIEASAFELPEAEATAEPIQRTPDRSTKLVAAAALLLIVVGLVLMMRPGPEDRVNVNERAQTTVAPTTIPPTTSIEVTVTTEVPLRLIPPFDSNVPEELPGVISGLDQRGSMLIINRALPRPVEHELGIEPSDEGSTLLGLPGGQLVRVDQELNVLGNQLVVEDSAALLRETIELFQLIPERDGNVLIVDSMGTRNVATLRTLNGGPEGDEVVWRGLSGGLEIVGSWDASLVVTRAGQTWLLPAEGPATPVAEGELLSYDGLHLTRLDCAVLDRCELVVGTPDAPELSRVALPEMVEAVAVEEWAGTLRVSPDGTMLALAARNGGISLPMVIDLVTGESRQLGDGVKNRSPMAWSPDGEWLAYVFSDDVMVWNLEADRSWRVNVNRELSTLIWQ